MCTVFRQAPIRQVTLKNLSLISLYYLKMRNIRNNHRKKRNYDLKYNPHYPIPNKTERYKKQRINRDKLIKVATFL